MSVIRIYRQSTESIGTLEELSFIDRNREQLGEANVLTGRQSIVRGGA